MWRGSDHRFRGSLREGACFNTKTGAPVGQRDDIDTMAIAQGIVMNSQGIGPEQAALVLFARAEEEGRPLAGVAADVVDRRDRKAQ